MDQKCHLICIFSERPQHEKDQYSWKRPFELSPTATPELYVDGTSRRDVIQGILGDCWLLSACAAIAKREELLHRVVPPNQVDHDYQNQNILLMLDYFVL